MSNIQLLSESFERAAFSHVEAMENFTHNGVARFEESTRQFSQAVDKLQAMLDAQAEKDERKENEESIRQIKRTDNFLREDFALRSEIKRRVEGERNG